MQEYNLTIGVYLLAVL